MCGSATKYGNSKADESIKGYKKTCEDAGCQIITLDDSVLAELREKAEPVYEMVREDLGDEIVTSSLMRLTQQSSKLAPEMRPGNHKTRSKAMKNK